MDRISHVAAGMAASSLEKRSEMWMARGSFTRNSGELRRGNADRL
jgi:hypothetical protein